MSGTTAGIIVICVVVVAALATWLLLVRRAADQGLTVISGLQMFLEQAARQFEIWTGASAPRSAMEKAAIEMLGCH